MAKLLTRADKITDVAMDSRRPESDSSGRQHNYWDVRCAGGVGVLGTSCCPGIVTVRRHKVCVTPSVAQTDEVVSWSPL